MNNNHLLACKIENVVTINCVVLPYENSIMTGFLGRRETEMSVAMGGT